MLLLMVVVCGYFRPAIFCTGYSGNGENAFTLISSHINSSEIRTATIADNGDMFNVEIITKYQTIKSLEGGNVSCFESQGVDKTTCTTCHLKSFEYSWRKASIYREFTVFEKRIFNIILPLVTILCVFNFSKKTFPVNYDNRDKEEKGHYNVDRDCGFYMEIPREIVVRMQSSFNTGAKPKAKNFVTNAIDRHGADRTLGHSGISTDENQASGYPGDMSNSSGSYNGDSRNENAYDQICKTDDPSSRNETKTSQTYVQQSKIPLSRSESSESTNETSPVKADEGRKGDVMIERAASSIQSQNTKLDNPKYRDIGARLQTFENWPRSIAGNIHEISDAGFYYVGFEDSVRCFCCGGGYYNFKPTTNPYSEHFRLYPSCGFIKQKLEERHNKSDANGINVGTAAQASDEHEPRRSDEETASIPDAKVTKTALSHTDIKRLLQMGIKKKRIEDLICRQLSNGHNEETTDPILQLLMAKQPENQVANNDVRDKSHTKTAERNGNDAALSSSGHMSTNEVGNQSENQTQVVNASETSDPSSDEEAVQSMRNENQQLREHLLCKICLDNDSSVVFLNCGHMVSCPDCSDNIRKCPICRKRIRGRVQIQ